MHILLGILAAAGAVYFFLIRARTAVDVADDIADMTQTALGAARRFGFRRRANQHPVESIEDPKLAAAGLATAFLHLGGLPTADGQSSLLQGLQSGLDVSMKDAEELAALGQFFVQACQGPDAAVPRIARKLNKLGGTEALMPAMAAIKVIAGDGDMTVQQTEALDEIKRVFRV